MTPADTNARLRDCRNRPRKWTADVLAQRLGLDYATRQRLGITTIGSTDVDKAERERRRRDGRNRYKREQRAHSREEYLGSHDLIHRAPWKAVGCSYPTWRRWRKKLKDAELPYDDRSVATTYARAHEHSPASRHERSGEHSSATPYKTRLLLPDPAHTPKPKNKAGRTRSRKASVIPTTAPAVRKGACQGVIPMPAVPKYNGRHPGGAPPSRNLITLAGFAHHDNGVKFVWSISADFLLACGLAEVKSVSIEARSDGWVRITEGDDFNLHAAHQTKQIYLYRRRMSQYRDYNAVKPFKAINCLAVIGRGYLDVKVPTTIEAKRAERKAA
jgi:hypothetical protein